MPPVVTGASAQGRRIGRRRGQIGQSADGFVAQWVPSSAVTGRSTRNTWASPGQLRWRFSAVAVQMTRVSRRP